MNKWIADKIIIFALWLIEISLKIAPEYTAMALVRLSESVLLGFVDE